MYNDYENYLKEVNTEDLSEVNFKSNAKFISILEHVSPKQGVAYLKLIEAEFPEITYDDIRKYVNINDKIGGSTKSIFTTTKNKMIYCSPTNMRYIYHALLILTAYKDSGCKQMVEMGCGYSGLFLAINMFQTKMDVKVGKYNMVDLPVVCTLIDNYLEINKDFVSIPYDIYESTNYGAEVPGDGLFFISNYCFSELDDNTRNQYVKTLFPKVEHGFIVFQTCFNLPLDSLNDMLVGKTIIKSEHERPQTAPAHAPNWFVYF